MAGSPDPGADTGEGAGELQVEAIRAALLLPAGGLVRALYELLHRVLCLPPPQVPLCESHRFPRYHGPGAEATTGDSSPKGMKGNVTMG